MRREAVAQAIIAVATTQDRAAAVVGDLLEEESSGGRVRFWWNVAGATVAFAWLNIVRFIFRRHFASGADNRGQLMEFCRFVWRRKWLIAVPMILATLTAAIVASRMPIVYRSTVRIAILPQQVPESFVRSSVDTKLEDRLASTRQQVLSRTRLERIVAEFNLYPEERRTRNMEDLIQRMRTDDIGIETMAARQDGDPATFRISFQSADRRTAMQVAERLASLFVSESLIERQRSAENTHTFLGTELEALAQQVDDIAVRMEQDRLAHRTIPRSDVLEYEEMEKTYRDLLTRRQQARLASMVERRQLGEQFRVIDPAGIPERPDGPDRASIILFGAGTGLAVGLLLALLASLRRGTPPAMSVSAAAVAAE